MTRRERERETRSESIESNHFHFIGLLLDFTPIYQAFPWKKLKLKLFSQRSVHFCRGKELLLVEQQVNVLVTK